MKFISYSIAATVITFTSGLLAQDSALKDLSQNLDQRKIEVEQSLGPIMEEKARIEETQGQLKMRLEEIESEKSHALSSVEQPFQASDLEEILIKNSPLGKCKIMRDSASQDLQIEQERTKIRFVFDGSKPLRAHLVSPNNSDIIEVQQEVFIPEGSSNKAGFKAVLRFEVGTEKIVHAVFTGERIEDGLLGWGSSRKPTILTCLIE